MTPKFRTIEVKPHETLGEKLKSIRLNLKFTYDEIEKRTKIRKKYIKAIEENNYDALPQDVYARGFLKNYSKVLNIPQDKVLAWYEKERGIAENIKQVDKRRDTKIKKNPRVIITPKILLFLSIFLISLAVGGYILYEVFLFSSPPKLELYSPEDNITISKSFVDIAGKTDPGTEIYINGQQVNISDDGDFKVNVSIGQNGVNKITILAKNPKNDKTKEITRNIIADIPEVNITDNNSEENAGNLNLTLEILSKTSLIEVRADGKDVFEGIMLPGTSKSFEASSVFILSTSNAGSTKIIFNNKDLGTLGGEGESIKDLKLDKDTVLSE